MRFLKFPSLIWCFAKFWGDSFEHSLFVGERGGHNLRLNCLFSRKINVLHYITLLFAGVVLPPRPINCFCNQLNLFANASLSSDSFQYPKRFFWIFDHFKFFLLLGQDLIFSLMCLKIALYSLLGQPELCLIFILRKNNDFYSGVLLKMPRSSPSMEEFDLDIQK